MIINQKRKSFKILRSLYVIKLNKIGKVTKFQKILDSISSIKLNLKRTQENRNWKKDSVTLMIPSQNKSPKSTQNSVLLMRLMIIRLMKIKMKDLVTLMIPSQTKSPKSTQNSVISTKLLVIRLLRMKMKDSVTLIVPSQNYNPQRKQKTELSMRFLEKSICLKKRHLLKRI